MVFRAGRGRVPGTKGMSSRTIIFPLFLILISAGCADLPVQPLRICPGAESAAEAVAVLDARTLNAVSFKASGRCRLKYHEDGREKNENFAVKLWMNPPSEIYMQGDVGFDPKGLVLGCNERDFWLALKPKEISSYWWGRWARNDAYESILINVTNKSRRSNTTRPGRS
jgi:hypothetical protein